MAEANVLMLAEKHNQADDYVKALKGKVSHPSKYNGYVIKVSHPQIPVQHKKLDTVYVSYLQGHVYELVDPDAYTPKWKRWSLKYLPMLPKVYKFKMSPKFAGGARHKNAIVDAAKNSDHLWLASDSDVEGENLGYIFMKKTGILNRLDGRVWQNSQTNSGLKRAFNHIRKPSETVGNARAGYSRMIADWNIGMNYSRVTTLVLNNKYKFPGVFSIGRVQTPLLALIAQRRAQRISFKPVITWRLAFKDKNGLNFLGDKKTASFKDKIKAGQVMQNLQSQPPVVSKSTTKHHSVGAPKLPKTGDVQGYLVKHNHITAQQALNKVLEPMYDTEKIISYPRTDCNMMVIDDFNRLKKDFPKYRALAEKILGKKLPDKLFGNMKPRKRYVDKTGKKVQKVGHSALIPEDTIDFAKYQKLPGVEKAAYKYILFHTLCMFANNFGYNQLVVDAKAGDYKFTATSKANISSEVGWHHIMGSVGSSSNINSNDYKTGQSLDGKYHLKQESTTPPTAITESNLIGKVMPHFKFGTQATRGGIIQRLTSKHLVTKAKRKDPKKTLVRGEFEPTSNGIIELEFMRKSKLLNIAKVSSWSDDMRAIAHGKCSFGEFINDINTTITDEMKKLPQEDYHFTIKPPKQKPKAKNFKQQDTGVTCPKCHKGHITLLSMDDPDDQGNYHHIKFYVCSQRKCKFYCPTSFEDLQLTSDVLKEIASGKFPYKQFTSTKVKNGKKVTSHFTAKLTFKNGNFKPIFKQNKMQLQHVYDITCPKCHKGKVGLRKWTSKKNGKHYAAYMCTNNPSCKLFLFPNVLGHKITPADLKNILAGNPCTFNYEYTYKRGKAKGKKGSSKVNVIYQNGRLEAKFINDKK